MPAGTGEGDARHGRIFMKFKLGLAMGAAAGYLVGSGKARELFDAARRSMMQSSGAPTASSAVVVTPMYPSDDQVTTAVYS
jgi:hypothetical protein